MIYISKSDIAAPIKLSSNNSDTPVDFTSVSTAQKLQKKPTPVQDPPEFDKFMEIIKLLEGTGQKDEGTAYSQYGVMATTVQSYIKDTDLAKKFIKRINTKTFTEDDARVFYRAMLGASKYAEIYYANGRKLAFMYADVVVNQGLSSANYFYKQAAASGKDLYTSFISYRMGGYLGQSYVLSDYWKPCGNRINNIESWLNRLDRVENAITGDIYAPTSFRELLMDCADNGALATLAKQWNVDPVFLKSLNANHGVNVRVPTFARKLYGEDNITNDKTGESDTAALQKTAGMYDVPQDMLHSFARVGNKWEKKHRIQLPITGIVVTTTNSAAVKAFKAQHPQAFKPAGCNYWLTVADYTKNAKQQDETKVPSSTGQKTSDLDRYNPNAHPTEVSQPDYRSNGRLHHYVKSGETLTSLKRDYGTSVARLKELNNLSSDDIEGGQDLIVK